MNFIHILIYNQRYKVKDMFLEDKKKKKGRQENGKITGKIKSLSVEGVGTLLKSVTLTS